MKTSILLAFCALTAALYVGCQSGGEMPPTPDDWSKVQTAEQLNAILSQHPVVVADFNASWCPPCRQLKPKLIKLSQEFKGKIHFVDIDADKAKPLASQYGVNGIPDIRFFLNGTPAPNPGFKGNQPIETIRPMLEALLNANP